MPGLYGAIPLGLNVNQLGASTSPRLAIVQPSPYQSALVVQVILNEEDDGYNEDGSNTGDIKVRYTVADDRNLPVEYLNWASPIDSSIEDYPLVNETVLVFHVLGRLFYTRRINSTKKVGESTWPGLNSILGPQPTGTDKVETTKLAAAGIEPYELNIRAGVDALDQVPNQNPTALRLRACQGDTIVYGRYGNTIRMGSNLFTQNVEESQFPEPNILISVGLSTPAEVSTDVKNAPRSIYSTMYENINRDKSSIWMVSNQKVSFVPATLNSLNHQISSSDPTKEYTGAQIFINSDRVVLNSKINEIALFSNNEINLSSIKSITLDTDSSVSLTAATGIILDSEGDIFIRGNTISFKANKDLAYKTSGNYSIVGSKIFIGSNADSTQPMVLGTSLAIFMQQLVSTLLVNVPTAFTPSPTGAVNLTALTLGLQDLQRSLANPLTAPFNSKANFTSEVNTV